MDRGAHFYNCDFQVHTPRDLNWQGDGATSDIERKEYANEFIKTCRTKGLGAVAITDHHDFAFFKYMKEASRNEVDQNGASIPEEERIVVFPGMELTIGVPCQAILILDADFPTDFLPQILTTLGVTPNAESEEKHAAVERLETIDDLIKLYEELNKHDWLRTRFIVLPNVSEGGNSTLIRSGFSSKYKQMPCVGGYYDGRIAPFGTGNRNIVEGKDQAYGNKCLGLFQTSDNRSRGHELLGQHTTWVKWSVPTAEAIRQACLARTSRISQEAPRFPSMYIKQVDISNCKFLGPQRFEFNQQYNALIGGRGTGKSTILEYLRWALCDQLPSFEKEDELPDFQTKRRNLISKTLLNWDAVIQVDFLINNIIHTVRRDAKTQEVKIKIGEEPFVVCSEEDLRNILPIQAYSQKQLSNVGVREAELIRFVTTPVKKQVYEISDQISTLKSTLAKAYEKIHQKRVLSKNTEKDNLELKSLNKQIDDLRKNLKGISKVDQITIQQQSLYEAEDAILNTWLGELRQTKDQLDSFRGSLANIPTQYDGLDKLPNAFLLTAMQDALKKDL
jgi:chromosome segregation protein